MWSKQGSRQGLALYKSQPQKRQQQDALGNGFTQSVVIGIMHFSEESLKEKRGQFGVL